MSNLQQLLTNLKAKVRDYQVKHYFNTGDVILWSDFERIWKMLENMEDYGWNCPKCTFWNRSDKSICEVCGGLKGDAPIYEKQKSIKKQDDKDKTDQPPTHLQCIYTMD